MMGEFERAAREKQIRDFTRWVNKYHAVEAQQPAGFDMSEAYAADQYQQALDRPTLAILDTVEALVRRTVVDMMHSPPDAATFFTEHDRRMFSILKVKY